MPKKYNVRRINSNIRVLCSPDTLDPLGLGREFSEKHKEKFKSVDGKTLYMICKELGIFPETMLALKFASVDKDILTSIRLLEMLLMKTKSGEISWMEETPQQLNFPSKISKRVPTSPHPLFRPEESWLAAQRTFYFHYYSYFYDDNATVISPIYHATYGDSSFYVCHINYLNEAREKSRKYLEEDEEEEEEEDDDEKKLPGISSYEFYFVHPECGVVPICTGRWRFHFIVPDHLISLYRLCSRLAKEKNGEAAKEKKITI